MTSKEIFKNAKWITMPESDAPIFKKSFCAQANEKAIITICGLGAFKLYINGKKVSEDLLAPNASNYCYRDLSGFLYPLFDELSFRTYCMQYDVTAFMKEGENTLAVMLGNSYYNQNRRTVEGDVFYGHPKLCYLLEKESGNVISDKSTLVNKGFITENNLFYGEAHDYSLLPCGDCFTESTETEADKTEFYIQTSPCDKVTRSLTPVLIKDEGKTKLYDAGENTVGYAVIACKEKGKKITVSYAEDIYDKENFGMHFEEGYQTDTFITDGIQAEYAPHFLWHGFRYFRIEGDAVPLRVDVVHSDCPVTSSFECDNPQLNWLYNAFIRTQLANMHCGIPSDCPHRERLGYTGDGQLCCEAAMMMLDSKEFYRKWLYDISDCQCLKTGHVQHTAPLMGGGGGPCGWGGAMVEVPYKFYKLYGDKDLLEEFFPKMLRYFDYLETRSENSLIYREEENGWCLGDWCAPEPIKIPEAYVNTCLYVLFMQQVLEIASILGREKEVTFLPERIERVKKAINVAYFSAASHNYCGDIQGANSLALQIGLGDEFTLRKTVEKYKKLGMYDTGIIATPALTQYLFENGEGQLAFDLLSSKGEVSFDYMARNGATTLWENWNGESSKNHPMFGAVSKCLFTYLLGIRQAEASSAYTDVVISPVFVDGINRAKGHITTENGVVAVEYVKDGSSAEITVNADEKIRASFSYNGVHKEFTGSIKIKVAI